MDDEPQLSIYAFGMLIFAAVGALVAVPSWFGLVVAVGGGVAALMLGAALFRRSWSRNCTNRTRFGSGFWLVVCGLVGVLLTMPLAYANLGGPSRPNYEMIRLIIYAKTVIWFFGGIILGLLGLVLIIRSLALSSQEDVCR